MRIIGEILFLLALSIVFGIGILAALELAGMAFGSDMAALPLSMGAAVAIFIMLLCEEFGDG